MSSPKLPPPEPIPGFNAVAFMREQRDRITRETAGMTVAQRVAYFKKGSSWYDDAKTGEKPRRHSPTGRRAKTPTPRRVRA